MINLKNSITFLFVYVLLVFGVAEVNYIELNVINFHPIFFLLMALAVLAGLYIPSVSKISIYGYLLLWALIYGAVWYFYWRVFKQPLLVQVLGLQFILVAIAAGLAFDMGRHIESLSRLLDGLSAATYPNRTLEIANAEDRISAELTRSRRYHHPLSLMIVELSKSRALHSGVNTEWFQKDLLDRFAVARLGQLLGEQARETDLVLRTNSRRFVLLCPDTNGENMAGFGERVQKAALEGMGVTLDWSFATFPDDALTFEELLERAEQKLK